jgi:hypothetical protein
MILEANGVSLDINGTAVPVQRINANTYEFNTDIALPEGTDVVEARATDDAGNVGVDRRTLDIRVPISFSVSDIRFTQTGLLNLDTPLPPRRVAGKTSLFRLMLQVRTSDGRSTSVDAASIAIEGGAVDHVFEGQNRPASGQFSEYGRGPIADGQQAYFFMNGRWLEPGRYRQELWIGFSSHAASFSSLPSTNSPFSNLAPALTSATRWAPVNFLHLLSAASISL